MGLCDRNCVILRTNRAWCTLNKEILDLLNEESISGASSGRASLVIRQEVAMVSRLLKCYSYFGSHIHIYYCMTGRAILGNIPFKIDHVSPTEGRDDTEVENRILPDPRNCNNNLLYNL